MKLKSKDVRPLREKLLAENNNNCELCGEQCVRPCLDHRHDSGVIRGVICSACNGVLGKVENGRRYGKDFNPVAFAKGLHKYLTKRRPALIHPTHKG